MSTIQSASINPPALTAALQYARIGWPVLPVHSVSNDSGVVVCSCGEPSCEHVGKHPRTKNGFKDATTDVKQIRAWWTHWPDANLGVRAGAESGLIVIDIDPRSGGDQTLTTLLQTHGPLPATVTADTGGGGQHFVFQHPGGKIKSRTIAAGIDCKADGGYIVAPPSTHRSGRCYAWRAGCGPGELSPAEMPAWLLALVQAAAAGIGSMKKTRRILPGEPVLEGQRNATLTSHAGRLRRAGKTHEQIEPELLDFNAANCQPPLHESEVKKIAVSVARYPAGNAVVYSVGHDGLYWDRSDGRHTRLTNFDARVVRSIIVDDGVSPVRTIELRVEVTGHPRERVFVTVAQFDQPSWVMQMLGAKAILWPDAPYPRVRAAIQQLSGSFPESRVFAHTGWRDIDDKPVYLHAGGGIGEQGVIQNVQVQFDANLDRYRLPDPPTGPALVKAIRSSLKLLALAPESITVPLLAAVPRAILGHCDFSLFLVGPTGCKKSETAALVQRFWGAGFTRTGLPLGWSSTANAIEDHAFRAKDAITVVDDFKPSGDVRSDHSLHEKADRVFRGQGNAAGRSRLGRNSEPMPPRPPRGLLVATGEDLPRGASLLARILILELHERDIDTSVLTACQTAGDAGDFAAVTAAFCQWAASRLTELQKEVRQGVTHGRGQFRGGHARLGGMLGELRQSLVIFLRFACESAAITANECAAIVLSADRAFRRLAAIQQRHQGDSEPASRFLELLGVAIVSGHAHLTDSQGGVPANATRWGWTHRVPGERDDQPMGERVGWVESDDVYLLPQPAFNAAQSAATPGERIPISLNMLARALHERGKLKTTERDRNSLRVRRMYCGVRVPVLHLSAADVVPDESALTSGDGPSPEGDP